MHEPADVGGELLRLGTRQQHAVIERMQEPVLRHPALLLDQDLVHDGDLAGGAAETQHGNPQPDAEGFPIGNAVAGKCAGTHQSLRHINLCTHLTTVMARSSNIVTESALVHSPTLPAPGKVVSSTP